nr:PREDICTED: methyltransferase-like protein 25 isoform X1 [Bemisia tabaci]
MSLNGFDSYDEYFSACCKFLGDNEWIFNYPVTEILVQDIPSLVPDSWIHALSSLSEEEFKTFPVYLVKEDWPASLIAFCQWSKKLKLKPEIFNPSEKLELPEIIKAGVTPKKTHEVDNLVPFIHSLCSDHSINRIVDIGSGLGYLDLFLYVKYGHTILGVESGKKLVETSTSRFQKVKAALPPNHVGEIKYIESFVNPESINSLSHKITTFFSERSDENDFISKSKEKSQINFTDVALEKSIASISNQNFTEKLSLSDSVKHTGKKQVEYSDCAKTNGVCLVGLHTCGDLCIDSLNLFMSTDCCKLCVLLACCYHKMTGQTPNGTNNIASSIPPSNSFRNFPLSSALKQSASNYPSASSFLQIPFLRLAANETADRWFHMSAEKHASQLFHTMARAVIQLYLHQNHLSTKKTKRRCVTKIPTNDFKAYVTSFLSRYHIFTESGETFHPNSTIIAAILDLWEKFKPKKKVISILLCLQANIQFVAESLIVADRVKYLLERNAKEVRVVRVMDDSVSPRALALCVHK